MNLLINPFAQFEDKPDYSVPSATLQIYNFIAEYLKREPSTHINRASSATLCYKRRWYQKEGHPGEPLTPRKMVNFTLGDLTEKVVLYFIKQGCVGEGKLYSEINFGKSTGYFTIQNKPIMVYEQEGLTAQIGDIEVTAHVDGWGKRNSDGEWELIEIKSAADYGFEEFKIKGPGDYLKQAMVNLNTNKAIELKAKSVRFFYLKKNTGHLWDSLHNFDQELFNEIIEEYKIASQKEEPKRPHVPQNETFRSKPTGRKVLPWQCCYCPYTKTCWPEAELEFKNNKPTWVIKGE